MSEPRDHHFIPEFYLKAWANPAHKNCLVEHQRHRGRFARKWKSPSATGYEFDLYAFEGLPPEQRQFLEKHFFQYADNSAAEALQLLQMGYDGKWNPTLRRAWSRFLVGIHLRHPDAMPELRDAATKIWDTRHPKNEHEYEKLKEPGDPESFADWCRQADPYVDGKAAVRLIMAAIDNEVLCQRIDKMWWEVAEVPEKSGRLLTSDQALQFSRMRSEKGFISLPIAPNLLFLATNTRRIYRRVMKAPAEYVLENVNKYVAARARRYVWSFDRSQDDFVQEFMSQDMEPTPFFPNLAAVKSLGDPA